MNSSAAAYAPSTKSASSKLKHFLLELVFPSFCASCGREGSFLCGDCRKTLRPAEAEDTVSFGTEIGETGNAGASTAYSDVAKIFTFFEYQKHGALAKLIQSLKYGFAFEMIDTLGAIM